MIFRQRFLDGIRSGQITLAFRRWRRPSVKTGGTLLTAAGQVAIGAVTPVTESEITSDAARRAGYDSRDALLAELNRYREGTLYRIELQGLRTDPRLALREAVPDDLDLARIADALIRLDRPAPWTGRTLEAIARHPGVRAGDLCALVGMDRDDFKLKVRKLKALGLTESLEVGYRLSPRGQAVLERATRGSR